MPHLLYLEAGMQRLYPISLQEAEIERITVQGQPGQTLLRPPSQQTSGVWWRMPITLTMQEVLVGGLQS
jgi:hypothetical protein